MRDLWALLLVFAAAILVIHAGIALLEWLGMVRP